MRLIFGLIMFLCILSFGCVRAYPDGPFGVIVIFEGHPIQTTNSIELSSSTTVNTHFAGGVYTKSPGQTRFVVSKITTPSANQFLDQWYQTQSNQSKNIYVRINDGSQELLEGWKIYSASIRSRSQNNDGSVSYDLDSIDSLERDLDVPFPG